MPGVEAEFGWGRYRPLGRVDNKHLVVEFALAVGPAGVYPLPPEALRVEQPAAECLEPLELEPVLSAEQ